jgi:hypothetical protein
MASNARYSLSLQRRVHPLFVKLYLADEAEEEYSDTRRPRRKIKAARRLTRKSALRRRTGGHRIQAWDNPSADCLADLEVLAPPGRVQAAAAGLPLRTGAVRPARLARPLLSFEFLT